MPRLHRNLLWTVLLAFGESLIPSGAAQAGICDCCQDEKRPQYVPICDPYYGFHRTGWRPWNPQTLHWHPNSGGAQVEAINGPMEPMNSTPTPALPDWVPNSIPSSNPGHAPMLPPLPDGSSEFAPPPAPLPTSQTEPQSRSRLEGRPVLYVGHSTLKPPKAPQTPNVIRPPASPYGDYRQTQSPR